jgi:alpha-tubulin suppressor-like RCC1 family protein
MGVMGMSGTMVSASAGRWTSCAVRADGYGFCWGRNTYGQIGNGTMTNSPTAREVSVVVHDLRVVDCGYESCCALRGTDHIACWGNGVDGAIGDGTTMDRSVPVETSGLHSYSSVETSGPWVSAVMRSGGIVRAWGYNGRGQLGNGTTTSANVPTPVTPP